MLADACLTLAMQPALRTRESRNAAGRRRAEAIIAVAIRNGQPIGEETKVEQVALEALFVSAAYGSFMVSPACLPDGFDDFVEFSVSARQSCELFRTAYVGATLRQRLKN